MTDQWQALGWTLVHFLWQAATIALLYRIADLLLTRSSAAVRYALAVAALVSMLSASLVTLAWEEAGNRPGAAPASEHALSFMVAGPPLPANVAQSAALPDYAAPQGDARRFQIDSMLPWLDGLWLAGFFACRCARWVAGGFWSACAASPWNRHLITCGFGSTCCGGSWGFALASTYDSRNASAIRLPRACCGHGSCFLFPRSPT